MYSLLLMTAMTSGGTMPAADAGVPVMVAPAVGYGGFGGSCLGCLGGCHGCWGSSCHGCFGGGCWGGGCNGRGGLFGGGRLFGRKAGRGCFGGGCNGCWGSSCYGGGCFGGGCWGGGCYGGGCYGAGHGPVYYHQGCYGSMAPIAGGGCLGGPGYTPYVPVAPAAPVIMGPAVPAEPTPAPAPATDESKSSANITIELPANATLYVDGQPVNGTGATRRFHTPELPTSQPFYYDMKAEVEVDGRTVAEEIKVIVRGGDNLTRTFGQLIALTGGTDRNVAVK